MGMSLSMAAMMVPSAAPFFIAYGRDSRRPAALGLLVLVYVGVWALIGIATDLAMGQVMLPSSWLLPAAAIALAVAYTVTPWSRWARTRCREMCRREAHGCRLRDALADSLRYSACCVVCSAGVMIAIVALGMSNLVVVGAGAALMLALKLPSLRELEARAR